MVRGGATTERSPADRLLAEGFAHLHRGGSVEAVAAFAAAVRAAPDRPVAYEALARALVYRNRLEQAMGCLRTAAALDPARATPLYEMARVERMRNHLPEAIHGWQRTLDLEPGHGRAHARLAAALWHAGDLEGARHHYDQARELGGMPARQLESLIGPQPATAPGVAVGSSEAPQISEPVQLDIDGAHAAEVSVAAAGDRVAVAWNDEREPGEAGGWRLGVALSDDAGVTWSGQLLRPPGGSARDSQGDPMTAVDPITGDLWVGGIDFGVGGQAYLARWPGEAAGLAPPVTVYDGFNDKGFAAAGPAPHLPGETLLHITTVRGLQTSADRGATWSAPILLGPEGAFDLGHVPRVDADGRLYIVFWDSDDGIWLQRSLDGGATVEPAKRIATRLDAWPVHDGSRFPGLFRVPPLPFMTVDAGGRLYVTWSDTTAVADGNSDVDLYLMRSDDQGATWTTPRPLPGVGRSGDQFFSWIEADAFGRLHLLWYDTRHTVQADDTPHGMLDVYYAWSDDQGASWTETRLTAASFDSFGMDWKLLRQQFLGDYLGLGVAGRRVYAGYATSASGELDLVVQRIDFSSSASQCQPGSTTLCLDGARFRVEARWETGDGGTGLGRAVTLTDETGYVWFFGADNVEMIVKVLDGCAVNGHKWVFLAGLTNVRVVATVTDTRTGAFRTYENPAGTPFAPVQDTSAFDTCP